MREGLIYASPCAVSHFTHTITITMGYGDLFVAALLGGVFANQRGTQRKAALLTFVAACLFDLLFFVVDNLPATVPVAVALLLTSACCGRSTPADGIPPPAK